MELSYIIIGSLFVPDLQKPQRIRFHCFRERCSSAPKHESFAVSVTASLCPCNSLLNSNWNIRYKRIVSNKQLVITPVFSCLTHSLCTREYNTYNKIAIHQVLSPVSPYSRPTTLLIEYSCNTCYKTHRHRVDSDYSSPLQSGPTACD